MSEFSSPDGVFAEDDIKVPGRAERLEMLLDPGSRKDFSPCLQHLR